MTRLERETGGDTMANMRPEPVGQTTVGLSAPEGYSSEEYQIRTLRKEELAESIRLGEFAFQYTLSPEERQERAVSLRTEELWGLFCEDQLLGRLMLFSFEVWIGWKRIAMGGIGGVATWPEHRGKGVAGKLIGHSLMIMKERGDLLSYLHPFSHSYYRKFGWETFDEYKKYEIGKNQLPKYPALYGKVLRTDDWRLLRPIYDAYAVRYNGMLARDERRWEEHLPKRVAGENAIYYDRAGKSRGYIRYQVGSRVLTVHEFICMDEEARRGLWAFIAGHESMIDRVELRAPSDDRLSFSMPDPMFKQEIVPHFMARIVDVKAFLVQFPFTAAGRERRFNMTVSDKYAPWNEGTFAVVIDASGQATVVGLEEGRRLAGGEWIGKACEDRAAEDESVGNPGRDGPVETGAAEYTICLDIGILTAMMLGYIRPAVLRDTGKLAASDAAVNMLETALPAWTSYFADHF